MPTTRTPSNDEVANRAAKAARLAKTALDAGINHGNSFLLDVEGMRHMILKATPRRGSDRVAARVPNVWDEASETTWIQVKEIVKVFSA